MIRRFAVVLLVGAMAGGCAVSSPGSARSTAAGDSGVPQFRASARSDSASVAFLIEESRERSRVADDLRHLTDVIGPRLTGSPQMRMANEWTAAKLKEYGADSVVLEGWPFGISWARGPLTFKILSPHERMVRAASWGWAPGTRGPRSGKVVFVDASTPAEFSRRFAGRLAGSWVMLSPPYPRVNPGGATAADSARVDSLRRAMRRERSSAEIEFLQRLDDVLAAENIAGEIIDGGKDFDLLTMSGSPDAISRYPQVVVGNQTYTEFHRLLDAADTARISVDVHNEMGRDTLVQWNTVGEIRGGERPDEFVLLGAHLDSWDLGTGATDNAAGSIAVLEAARLLGALKAKGVRPRRTIRFVLFSGEEQGLLGSQYYVLRHRAELPRFQAVLVLDNGTGRIVGVPLQGQDELRDLWMGMMRPLAELGPFTVRSGNKGGTDHLPFLHARVPAFNYDQLSRGYDFTHHSQADVFDYAVPADVAQAAAIMAVNALQLANLDVLLPRRRQ